MIKNIALTIGICCQPLYAIAGSTATATVTMTISDSVYRSYEGPLKETIINEAVSYDKKTSLPFLSRLSSDIKLYNFEDNTKDKDSGIQVDSVNNLTIEEVREKLNISVEIYRDNFIVIFRTFRLYPGTKDQWYVMYIIEEPASRNYMEEYSKNPDIYIKDNIKFNEDNVTARPINNIIDLFN